MCSDKPGAQKCAAIIVHRTEQPSREIFSIQNIKDKTNYGNKYRKESIRRFCNVSLNVCARLQLRHRCDASIQQGFKPRQLCIVENTPRVYDYYSQSLVHIRRNKMCAPAPVCVCVCFENSSSVFSETTARVNDIGWQHIKPATASVGKTCKKDLCAWPTKCVLASSSVRCGKKF